MISNRLTGAAARLGRIAIVLLLGANAGFATPAGAQLISTFSGGNFGDGGLATSGNLAYPRRVTVDSAGNLFIADTWQQRVRRVDATTGVITTVAGTGVSGYSGDGGPATSATLSYPTAVTHDASGNLFIAEELNNVIRRVDAVTGAITTIAGNGTSGLSGDGGPATAAQFNVPNALAFDAGGDLLVVDRLNHCIRKITISTGIVTRVAGTGAAGYSGDGGLATAATLNAPRSFTVDSSGDLYVADTGNNRIRRIDGSTGVITSVAGTGAAGFAGDGGLATAAVLSTPADVVVDATGSLFIADLANARVRKVAAGTGIITTVAGKSEAGYDGDGAPATDYALFGPVDLAFDPDGNLIIAEALNHRMRKLVLGTSTISTVAGGTVVGDGGAATTANHKLPADVAVDAAGNVYIADMDNQTIRKVSAATGVITTIAGNGTWGFGGDGGPATAARFRYTMGVAVDSAGNVYVADVDNHRIRKVATGTGIVTTIAGNGTCGALGDNGPATSAQLCYPWGLAVTPAGDIVFIADTANNRVRRVDTIAGDIKTIAGTGAAGYAGDGGVGTAAQLSSPRRVSLGPDGNLYIADTGNYRVRKLTVAGGIISTVAGTGTYGFSGDGGSATAAMLANASGLAVDTAGDLYIADEDMNRIRKVSAGTGIINTIAGNGAYTYGGDGGPATAAALMGPRGIAVDGRRNVFVADWANHRVRKVTQPATRGDVNADGKADLFWREAAPGLGLSWWTMNGNASTGANYHQVDASWQIADLGDVDGDGKADVIWRRASDGANYLWTLDGLGFKGFFDLGILSPAQWSLTGIADLDGDGKGDVVWRGTDGTVYGWIMNGGTIASQGVIGNPGTQWVIADLADMDGDGKADIVFRNTNDGGVYIYFMNGLALASGGFVGIVDPAAWTLVGAADFSGDGKADFLWRHTSGDTWVWLMNGATFGSAGGIGNPGAGWSVKSLGDFDGDGKADMIWRHTDGTTYLWTMNGLSVSGYLPVANPGGTWQPVAP